MAGLASCLLVRCENPEVHYVAHIKLTSRVVPSNVCAPKTKRSLARRWSSVAPIDEAKSLRTESEPRSVTARMAWQAHGQSRRQPLGHRPSHTWYRLRCDGPPSMKAFNAGGRKGRRVYLCDPGVLGVQRHFQTVIRTRMNVREVPYFAATSCRLLSAFVGGAVGYSPEKQA